MGGEDIFLFVPSHVLDEKHENELIAKGSNPWWDKSLKLLEYSIVINNELACSFEKISLKEMGLKKKMVVRFILGIINKAWNTKLKNSVWKRHYIYKLYTLKINSVTTSKHLRRIFIICEST